MDLKQKGASAEMGSFRQLVVRMSWTSPVDFDLAAIWKAKDGRDGIVYFGDLGDLNAFPFIALSGDEGVGDAGGDNEESMRIVRLDDMAFVWIFCWDYNATQSGQPARFGGSDLGLAVVDDRGTSHAVTLDGSANANVACIATIDNSSPIGARLINTSSYGLIHELRNSEQLLQVVGVR